MDYYYGIDPTPFDIIKDQVERLIDDKLDEYTVKQMKRWHRSMSARVQSCRHKIDKNIQLFCYKNLLEDLSGYEAQFRGQNTNEVAMSIKYYDVYVTTYLSVSYMLRNISGPAQQASIDRDLKFKANIFARYLERAVEITKGYTCRYIKVRLVEDYIFMKKERLVWPDDREIYKYMNSSLDFFDVREELLNKSIKCGFFDHRNKYLSTVVDVRDNTLYPGGDFSDKYCRTDLAIPGLVPLSFVYWRVFMKKCGAADDKEWIRRIENRAQVLKEMAVKDLPKRKF